MLKIKEWFERKNNIVRKTAGLEEKRLATQQKSEVYLSILNNPAFDRRKAPCPVEEERRRELYDYHQKLA